MSISLCMICGNESAVILDCLNSVVGVFDELCLVRAIGQAEPDNTVELAARFCEVHGKEFKSTEYINRVDMPHVDHFGDARQLAFDLATCDWLMWLDCDDIVDDIDGKRLVEASKTLPDDVNGLRCNYVMEGGKGGLISRERLIRRNAGRWRDAIHETCTVTGKVLDCPQITVKHRKIDHKRQGSSTRNAKILEGVLPGATRAVFYASHEFKNVDKAKAIRYAKASLELLDADRAEERYVVLLELSALETENASEWLAKAMLCQPHRREAFAYLCQEALKRKNLSDAQSYFRMLDALPLPSPLPWTHQDIWHGVGRDFLLVKILNAIGQTEQAEKIHAQLLTVPEYAELWT